MGGHNLRIGGASAAHLAANVSEAVIRAMGRWDSDVYELYLRGSLSCARQMGSVIASTSYEDFEAMFDHEDTRSSSDPDGLTHRFATLGYECRSRYRH